MPNSLAFLELREQAIALRRAGKSRREIKELLHIGSNATLNDALRGEPPHPRNIRPNAKDDVRDLARELRIRGLDYEEIAAELGVSKSSVSLWVRDLPVPERLSYAECRKRSSQGVAKYWEAERPRRDAIRAGTVAAASSQIRGLTDRDVLVAGAIAYWCEGSKRKPYRHCDRVVFINSDPLLIKFFLRFVEVAGVSLDRLTFRVSIHESADVAAAQEFWLAVTQADPAQFRRPNLKRHKVETTRKNTGDSYHGCLRVEVLRSAVLYQRIEGWCHAIMTQAAAEASLTCSSGEEVGGPSLISPVS
jgi:predicted transcriptional regulator